MIRGGSGRQTSGTFRGFGPPSRKEHGIPTRLILSACLGLAVPTAPLHAQDAANPRSLEAGPILLELSQSPRALGLGGAFVAGGGDSDGIFYHPALIAQAGVGGSFQRFGEGGSVLSMSGGTGWFGGNVGIGVSFLEYGTDQPSPSALRRDTGALALGGPVAASEFLASLGFAYEVLGVDLGATAKAIGQRLGASRGSTYAMDVGIAAELGPATVALTGQNLGPDLELAGESVPLARRVVFGAATDRTPVGPLDIGAAVQVIRDGAGDILPGGGVEIAWWPIQRRTFIARIGAQRIVEGTGSALTLGGGFTGDRLRIDYAYQGYDPLKGAHSVAVAFR